MATEPSDSGLATTYQAFVSAARQMANACESAGLRGDVEEAASYAASAREILSGLMDLDAIDRARLLHDVIDQLHEQLTQGASDEARAAIGGFAWALHQALPSQQGVGARA